MDRDAPSVREGQEGIAAVAYYPCRLAVGTAYRPVASLLRPEAGMGTACSVALQASVVLRPCLVVGREACRRALVAYRSEGKAACSVACWVLLGC